MVFQGFVLYIIFGEHSTHGEWLVELSLFLELIDILLAASIDVYRKVQHLLMTRSKSFDIADY